MNTHTLRFKCMNCGKLFPEEKLYRGSMGGDFCSERCYEDYLENIVEEI